MNHAKLCLVALAFTHSAYAALPSFGAVQVRPGTPPQLYVIPESAPPGMRDICKQCLANTSDPKPNICWMILCRAPRPDALTFPITSPSGAKACEDCSKIPGLAPVCLPRSCINESASSKVDTTRAYKSWLEMSRIGADDLRAQKQISAGEYRQFLNAYREDWRTLLKQ